MRGTILITFGTRPFGQRIGRLLASRYKVAYASSDPFPEVLKELGYRRIPIGDSPTFAHEILKLCLDEGYNFVLPLGKQEGQPLHEARVLMAEYGVKVLWPSESDERFFLESPSGTVHVLQEGKDMLTEKQESEAYFSGVAMLSDGGGQPILCLI